MTTATKAKLNIGDSVPGHEFFTVKPVVRLDSWNSRGFWLPLEKFDGSDCFLDSIFGGARVYPAWSAEPEYILPHNAGGYRPAVRVFITGRTPVRNGGEYWLRGRVEFCHVDEPSQFSPCWILLD
jgi:hypothetical protein